MNPLALRTWIETSGEFSFSRSAGPGGQNVNKLNTKVTLSLNLSEIEGLTPEEQLRLQQRLHTRISSDNRLVLQVQDTRSQIGNREIAVLRAADLIASSVKQNKKRRPTAPTKASKARRISGKKQRGAIKKDRKNPGSDEY